MEIQTKDINTIWFNRVDLKDDILLGIIDVAVSSNSVLVAKDRNNLRRKSVKEEFEDIVFPSEFEISRVFSDPYGIHSIITTTSNESFYLPLNSKEIIPLIKLHGIEISSIGFSLSKSTSYTDYFLIGTTSGTILSYRLNISSNGVYETDPEVVFDFFSLNPVYGLAFDLYEMQSERTLEGRTQSYIEVKAVVLAVTTNNYYSFIGSMPFDKVFEEYWDKKKFQESSIQASKISMLENELKLFYTVNSNRIFELHTAAWKTDSSVCYQNFRAKGARNLPILSQDTLYSGYQRKAQIKKHLEIPKAIAISDRYVYMLYSDNLTVVLKETSQIEYSHDFMIGENMKQMAYEAHSRKLWLWSRKGVYQLSDNFKTEETWKDMLDSFNYKEALQKARNEDKKVYSAIAGIYADKKFAKGNYEKAIELYAESSKTFEYIVLKLLSKGKSLDSLISKFNKAI